MSETSDSDPPTWYHGTRAELKLGDLLVPGKPSNFGSGAAMSWVYFTATLDAAIWGAELARGDGRQRIYVIEPTGPFEDDPNLTDKKYPGNVTRSYRSRHGLRVVGELVSWDGHTPEQLRAMREGLAILAAEGRDIIID
ncbi:NAD(+)--rifampin ADP-ribosyltransferase [Maritimibacter dapengensis]|uniref:NAD(+)--rifampin ADP-ribosyltransferase n=1 Tax=Maritimibacter dapengensis TaxID=2836868 RepID=A0ABS6SWK9_9RHOB|nr:NAD(+)--rifampin ADP-ribosyltransferase [Maritimibacter dapengensis]MBV7377332.1 NAD(+)--rifampin ADP-ribosyltransferase [Maritimibacter dapengensis]